MGMDWFTAALGWQPRGDPGTGGRVDLAWPAPGLPGLDDLDDLVE